MLDRSPLLAEHLPDAWLPAEGADLTRTHHFEIYSGRGDGAGFTLVVEVPCFLPIPLF